MRLEVRHRQTVTELQSQLSALQERAREMEREKEAQTIQHHSSMQQHSHSLSSMEKVGGGLSCDYLYTFTLSTLFDRSCQDC